MQQNNLGKTPISAETCDAILQGWREANPAIASCTLHQAVERLKALEHLWTVLKVVLASEFAYDKDIPFAIKAMQRADKSVLQCADEHEILARCDDE